MTYNMDGCTKLREFNGAGRKCVVWCLPGGYRVQVSAFCDFATVEREKDFRDYAPACTYAERTCMLHTRLW